MSDLRSALFGCSDETTAGADDFYECTYCGVSFREWPGGCSECGQLVVRIVEHDTNPNP